MLTVLFAVSYQSLHTFSHHKHEETNSNSTEKKFSQILTEKEDCPVCDFKFANFLSPEVFTFTFFPPYYEIPYSFSIKESHNVFCGSFFFSSRTACNLICSKIKNRV